MSADKNFDRHGERRAICNTLNNRDLISTTDSFFRRYSRRQTRRLYLFSGRKPGASILQLKYFGNYISINLSSSGGLSNTHRLLSVFIGFLINKRANLGGITPVFAPLTSSRRRERSITLANASHGAVHS